jgi:hypothetical protein
MKYSTEQNNKNKTGNEIPKRNLLTFILSGDFLLQRKTLEYIPFIILFFGLALTAIINQKSIKQKTKWIDKKEIEYKMILNELKKSNQFIPYNQLSIIQEQAKSMGFVKNNSNTYKITIKSNNSK